MNGLTEVLINIFITFLNDVSTKSKSLKANKMDSEVVKKMQMNL